jgi:hypothetical protein
MTEGVNNMSNLWYLLAHVMISICVFVIAYKSGHEWSWLAFIPLANIWLLFNMADASLWYLLLFLIPIVNIAVYVWLWARIAENTNKPSWLGLLMILPVINVGAAIYMAFYEPDTIRA